jgi:hypothetical protein
VSIRYISVSSEKFNSRFVNKILSKKTRDKKIISEYGHSSKVYKIKQLRKELHSRAIFVHLYLTLIKFSSVKPWWCCLVVLSPPATEETGAMGREVESRRGIGW